MLTGATQWQTAHQIVRHIVDRRLQSDDHLNEQALAREFGVSRTPVRAALAHLQSLGVLDHRDREGYFLVRPLTRAEDAGLESDDADDLYGRILHDILQKEFDRTISESALMSRYGVHRGELSAVLRRMLREGFVEPSPGHGWSFIQFSGELIEQGYRMRLILEPNAILQPDYTVDRGALERLRDDHKLMIEDFSRRTSWDELFSLDARLHETIAAGSDNPFIVEAIQKQNRIRRLNEFLGYERHDRVYASLIEHRAILDSLLDGDLAWAAHLMREHLRKSLNQSLSHYDQDVEDFRAGRRHFHQGDVRHEGRV